MVNNCDNCKHATRTWHNLTYLYKCGKSGATTSMLFYCKEWEQKPYAPTDKFCGLCGALLGEWCYVGFTHPAVKLGAVTCEDHECTRWLEIKIRVRRKEDV